VFFHFIHHKEKPHLSAGPGCLLVQCEGPDTAGACLAVRIRTISAKAQGVRSVSDHPPDADCLATKPEIGKGYPFANSAKRPVTIVVLLAADDGSVDENSRVPERLLADEVATVEAVSSFVLISP